MIRRQGPGPTELVIVGVAHLTAAVPDAAIARGRNILHGWRPDLIAIENLPGHLVVEYEERGGPFAAFGVGAAPDARAGAAAVADRRPWNVWQARRVATDPRARLTDRVIGWLLAREPDNALLLPWRDAELPAAAQALLGRLEASPSERVRLGVWLARALGHERLIHFDDHEGVGLIGHYPADWITIEQRYQEQEIDRPAAESDHDHWQKWVGAESAQAVEFLERTESAARATHPDPTGVIRARLAQWRARNLAMAARLREASGLVPGGRLLAIVGSSHGPPLRAALAADQHDLTLVKLATLENFRATR